MVKIPENAKLLLKGEYYYSPHHKYAGIFELYWVDKNKIAHCIQNFCLESSAETLASEDKAWRLNGGKLLHSIRCTEDLLGLPDDTNDGTSQNYQEPTEVEKKKERSKRRREARKQKEKQ